MRLYALPESHIGDDKPKVGRVNHFKQEAQLPQRNSASAAHIYPEPYIPRLCTCIPVYLGWPADLLMITHSRLVVQCTVYGKIAEIASYADAL